MNIVVALFPLVALIAMGHVLKRTQFVKDEFWANSEKLNYFILFPILLFTNLADVQLDVQQIMQLLLAFFITVFSASAMLWMMKRIYRIPPARFGVYLQSHIRFNTYIGIAVVDRLAGGPGIAALALLVGVLVPAVNALAVWFLARHGGHSVWREIVRNPLIIATVSGFICKLFGVTAPDTAMHLLDLFAVAATPLGLLAVGAGLRSEGLRQNLALINGMTVIKLVVVPALAWGLAEWFDLSGMYRTAAIVLATLPTASSAYILAVRMGGDGKLVASIITMNIFVGMLTLPLWLAFTL